MNIQPLSITFKSHCRVTDQWFTYTIPLEEMSEIEQDVEIFLEAEGWIDGVSPGNYVEPQLTDY